MRAMWQRRSAPVVGQAPADRVLESGFAPLVPRRFGGLVALVVDSAGTHTWSAGTWGTLPAVDGPAVDDDRPEAEAAPVFQIASVTKIFTALLLADAVSAGLVALDEPVEAVLDVPLRVGGRPVTFQDLATHRSGLPFVPESMKHDATVDERDPYRTYDDQKLLAAAAAAVDRTRPGRDAPVRYSNFGFALLGLALARRFGTSYAQALHHRVLVPAGLSHTSLRPASPRAVRVDGRGGPSLVQEFAAFAPAGGLWMSAADLGRWLTLLTEAVGERGGERPADQDHARALVRTTTVARAGSGSERLGLAWRLPEREQVAWHNGGIPGASSFVGVHRHRASAVGVFALGNSAGHLDRAAFHALSGRAPRRA